MGTTETLAVRQASERERLERLRVLVDEQRTASFRPEVLDQIEDERALAALVARYLHWDGEAIRRMAARAFDEANFHELARQLDEMEVT